MAVEDGFELCLKLVFELKNRGPPAPPLPNAGILRNTILDEPRQALKGIHILIFPCGGSDRATFKNITLACLSFHYMKFTHIPNSLTDFKIFISIGPIIGNFDFQSI